MASCPGEKVASEDGLRQSFDHQLESPDEQDLLVGLVQKAKQIRLKNSYCKKYIINFQKYF